MSLDVPATLAANQKRVDNEARLAKGKDKVTDEMAQQLLKNASPGDKKRVVDAAKKRTKPIKVHMDDAVRNRMLTHFSIYSPFLNQPWGWYRYLPMQTLGCWNLSIRFRPLADS